MVRLFLHPFLLRIRFESNPPVKLGQFSIPAGQVSEVAVVNLAHP